MGQIVGTKAKPKRANLNALSQVGTPALGEYVLVSSNNSMSADGQGNFDAYIIGDGTTAASALELQYVDGGILVNLLDKTTIYDSANFNSGYISSSGSVESSNTYYYTNPIFIDTNETVYYKLGGTSFSYLSKASSESDAGPYTPVKAGAAGEGEYTPTEAGWYVFSTSKTGFKYLRKETPGLISTVEDISKILTEDKLVNSLTEGGSTKPLSAEQGKILNDNVAVLNQYSIPLSRGGIYDKRGGITSAYKRARAVFRNSGFDVLRVKQGYEYVLYSSDTTIYQGSSSYILIPIISSYTSEPYVNSATRNYFWIDVKKADGSSFQLDELYNVVTLELDSSTYSFKALNDVSDYYKLGVQYVIEDVEKVSNSGWDNNGLEITTSGEVRTGYIDVSGIDAIKMRVSTTNTTDGNGDTSRVVCKWFDEELNAVGHSKYLSRRGEFVLIIGVPNGAKYVSIYHATFDVTQETLVAMKHEKCTADSIYYKAGRNAIGKLPRVSLFLVYGQSLSLGSGSSSITKEQRYAPLKMLYGNTVSSLGDQGFVDLKAKGNSEDPSFGAAEMFVEAIEKENGVSVYANEWDRHFIVFASCGTGMRNITQLSSSSLYQYVEGAITKTKTLCDEFGFDMEVPAWCWMQGEQDMKAVSQDGVPAISTPDAYKNALLSLHEQVCSSVSAIVGTTKRPKCIIYQPASQCLYSSSYGFSNTYLAFNNAYVELLRDNDEFLASAPAYIFDEASGTGGFIHLNARSYKILGAYNGYAAKKSIIDNVNIKGVIPLTFTVDDTTITIKYNVPCPPLKFDTEWVKETPLVNGVHTYGFNVVKNDDTELITSVSVFDDTVTIECSESPVGAKLRYGLNGDYFLVPTNTGTFYSRDGRVHGGRGNLRDSQGDYVQKEIRELGQTMRLDNWAYCFEKVLE